MDEAVGAPVDIRLPYNAPELMELVFRLGLVSARHAAILVDGGMSERRSREILGELHRARLVARNRTAVPYSPSNVGLLETPRARGRRAWEDLYSLTDDEGVRYAAELMGLPLRAARARYNRSYVPGRREHTYLRTEFYAMIVDELPEDLRLVRLEAEGGVGRCLLPHRAGSGRRRLEPDGLVVFEDLDPGGGAEPDGDRLTIFVESDTGKQRAPSQIGEKAERYAQMYLSENTDGFDFDVSERPPVLFVSPTRSRSATVGRFIQQAADADDGSPLNELHLERKREGHPEGALDLFCLTNLQALRKAGAWGDAYRYLCDHKPGQLL